MEEYTAEVEAMLTIRARAEAEKMGALRAAHFASERKAKREGKTGTAVVVGGPVQKKAKKGPVV
jgi:hypothetical protein